ncbi:MAG: hypothetical protein SF187_16620 [Deltaproteobacteria bacterium]|nr:hypothetical protein [Deltaproteobacteria bacterium]
MRQKNPSVTKLVAVKRAQIAGPLTALVTVAGLAITGPALAQAEADPNPPAAPATAEAPAEPVPTTAVPDERPMPPPPPRATTSGGTGYNPQGYNAQGYNPQYSGYYPPPPPQGVYRPFSFSVGLGPGFLALKNETVDNSSSAGAVYSLRFGFGVQPNLSIVLGFEGASAQKDGVRANQDALLLGIQYFFHQVIYVRGGMGIANETEEDNLGIAVDQNGFAFQGALGVDLLQSSNVALSLEGGVLVGRYPGEPNSDGETWTSGGLSLVFSLY